MCYTFTIGNIFSQSQEQKQRIENKSYFTKVHTHTLEFWMSVIIQTKQLYILPREYLWWTGIIEKNTIM